VWRIPDEHYVPSGSVQVPLWKFQLCHFPAFDIYLIENQKKEMEVKKNFRFASLTMLMRIADFRSGFLKNFTTLLTGTAISQAIPVLLQPLLRRVFDADMFAMYAVYNSITSILIVLTTLRYETAIVLPEEDRPAKGLVILSLGINTVFSLIFLVFIALFPSFTENVLDWPSGMHAWLWMIPPGVFLFSASQVLNYWLIRKKAFRASASNRITRRVAEGAVQSGGGLMHWQGGLIWGDIAGRIFNLYVSFRQAVRFGFSFGDISVGEIKAAARRYRDFPLFQALPALLNTASLMLPILIINNLYNNQITARFDLSRQVLALPLALITTAMSQVLMQKFAEQRNRHQPILPGMLRITAFTGMGAVLVVLFFILTGYPLFAFLFGKEWGMAGTYAAILAPAYMIQFVVSPISTLIITLERVRLGALWQILYFVAIISLTLFRGFSEEMFFHFFTLINLVFYSLYWLLILFIVLRYERDRGNLLKKSVGLHDSSRA
jgi:O-antigen/teichoic acid export membrane protein